MSLPVAYSPLKSFAAPARGSSAIAVFGGVLLVAFAYFAAQTAVLGVVLPPQPGDAAPVALSRGAVLLFLLTYLAPLAAIIFWVRRVHRRPATTLAGPGVRTWQHFLRTALWVGLVMVAILALPPWEVEILQLNPVLPWLALLPLMLPAIFIQTATEEIIFRGYIQQELASRFESRIVWMVLPSLVFGALHWGNGSSPADSFLYAGVITVFALLSTDLTARTGALGASIGLHFAVNCQSLLLFGEQGIGLERASLAVLPAQDPALNGIALTDLFSVFGILVIAFGALPIVLYWLAARVAVGR
ncbi:CPBP family intramembrane glutamic endopeptidase [Pseudoroseicyclus tamaricis]|uniref:CPBP family intramembrane metalloprotease n=1 Tax=Pseudoroseicyclus tamaricis TaxID=2705421 RepID=A0A6B2K147_9RHOB|nr:type II CAAX endopeptidase family protein [Pseudoroseicyclus tamaricis]NDV02669.1 CPBP family intramembrane metalloprotease [Pseudoroseicyclus tamaricis]